MIYFQVLSDLCPSPSSLALHSGLSWASQCSTALEKFFADNLSSMIYCVLNVTYYDSIFQFDIFNQTC